MTIEKHGNKWRIKEMVNGTTYRMTVEEKPSKRDAQRLINELIESQDVPVKGAKTFYHAGNDYIELKSKVLSPTTLKSYGGILRNLPEWFSGKKLSELTPVDVQKVINDLTVDHSPKCVRNYHGFISAVLGVYRPNMHLNTTLPQKAKFEPYTPIEDDIKKVLAAVKDTRYEIPYRLGCYGLRRSEVCALTVADLDGNFLSINKAYVTDKNNKWIIKDMGKTTESTRTIYIDDNLADMIRKANGRLYDGYPNMLNTHLHRVQKRLDLPSFRFHDLRAYYASMAHALGIPDKYIMANGGWSSPYVMQRVYRRAMSDTAAEMNKKFAGIFE